MDRKILVVEDDRKTVDLLSMYFKREGFQVFTAYDGAQALEIARRTRPHLVVLDLMLPEVDGLDVCRILRAESNVPIIMLTARTTEEERLRGLNLGADDYVVKPFSPLEVVARVRAVLRRTGDEDETGSGQLHVGELVIDTLRHEVRLGDRPITLTPKEFRLLEILAREPGRVFSRVELMDQAFGLNYEGLERTIDVHIMNLRRKLEIDPTRPETICTVFGVGYKLAEGADA